MQVKDLTVEELKLLIQETVAETLHTLLIDPDQGKELKPEVKQQLLNYLEKTQSGERGVLAEEVARKLGLSTPFRTSSDRRSSLGQDRGKFVVSNDFNAPLPEEILAAFEGDVG
jgi:hypothetical protein